VDALMPESPHICRTCKFAEWESPKRIQTNRETWGDCTWQLPDEPRPLCFLEIDNRLMVFMADESICPVWKSTGDQEKH